MVMHTLSDELRQFVLRAKNANEVSDSIQYLIEYANRAFNALASRYSQMTPHISLPNFSVHMLPYQRGRDEPFSMRFDTPASRV